MNDRYVYVIRNAGNHAIYVGLSGDPMMRLRRHATRPWADQIASMEVIPCGATEEAALLERRLIAELRPTHNVMANPDAPRRSRGTRQMQVLDLLLAEGEMTQCQAERWFAERGHDGSKSFVGTSLHRLRAKGLVEVIGRVPSASGRWPTAAVFAPTAAVKKASAA
jgi:predicted GIY-YIG superfamily endonuclease